MSYVHKMQILYHQDGGVTPPHIYIYIYLIIFWSGSFMLNMNAIFEHWAVTLLGCLLVDKTWKSNLLSWVCLKIYSAERGGVERQVTSFYLSPIPACFLRNEMEGEGQGREDTHTYTCTHIHTHTPVHAQPKRMTVFPLPLHFLPAPYFRGTLPTITLLSKRRSRANIRAFPELSAKLWTSSSQRTDAPALLPSWLHTEEYKELFRELKALPVCFVKRGSVWSQCECLVLWDDKWQLSNGKWVTATKNKGWSRGRDGEGRSLIFDEFSSFPFSPSWA